MIKLSDDFLTDRLKKTDKPIVLYGMGNGADRIISMLSHEGIEISGVFVSDGFVRDKTFHGFPLTSYADTCDKFRDFVVLVSFGTNLPDVTANIYRIASERELYAPYVPVTGEGVFDRAYVTEHMTDFDRVYERLADDLSRKTLLSVLNYRITGDLRCLRECESDTDDIYGILHLTRDEVYADLGAYRGDTIDEFITYAGDYRAIYAAEPDTKTFTKLRAHTEGMRDVTLYNAAAYSHSRGVCFAVRGGRNSSVGGDRLLPSVTLDEMCADSPATYVKMDIEGAECEAIQGGAQLIAGYKPKMRIAAYHRTGDLTDIPDKVLSLCPNYRIYLRHRPYVPDWDTDFLFLE